MKKLILLLVVLGFLKGEVKAQAVEWVQTISGVGSLKYVNDSLIYLVESKACFQKTGYLCPKTVSILNENGKSLKSKPSLYSPNIFYNYLNLQQKFILSNNRVLFSREGFIIDKELNIKTLTGLSSSFALNNTYPDYSKVEISLGYREYNIQFSTLDSNNVRLKQNTLYRDPCFYEYDCVHGIPYYDRNKTLFFSRCSSFGHKNLCSSFPSNYIAVNTIGSNIVTYASQKDAAILSVISYDSSNNIRFLPYYDFSVNSAVPEYFQEDSKGNMFILGYYGVLGKYRKNPWDSIWTKRLGGYGTGHDGILQIDKQDRIYATYDSAVGTSVKIIDSSGSVLAKKLFPNGKILDVQSDSKNSIYVAIDVSKYNFNSPNNSLRYLDCYTMSGNYIAKLYTGTLPSTPKLTQSGLVLKSNFPRGVTWYRNDSLLTSENDTFTLALRDGKYTFKAFCKQDTFNFKGISYPNGTLTTMSIPGATYQWSLNDVPIPNAITNTYFPASVGKYTVIINFEKNQALFSTGRMSVSNTYQATYSLNLVQLSVDNDNSQHFTGYFSIFPNPTAQSLTIKTAGFTQIPQANVLNSLGQEVTSLLLSSDQTSLDVSSFPKGIYSIKVGNQVQKLVVE